MLQNYGNDMTEKAVRICRSYLPGAWKKAGLADVEVNRIRYVANCVTHIVRSRDDSFRRNAELTMARVSRRNSYRARFRAICFVCR